MEKAKTTPAFKPVVLKEDESTAVLKWYHWLHDDKQKGVRARLKRCDSLEAVIPEPGFLRLSQSLPRLNQYNLMGIALAAGLLAVAKNEDQASITTLAGRAKEGGDKPVLSELRFQRLLAADDEEQLFQALRRAIIQVGEKANPLALADSVLHWQRESQRPEWFPGDRKWQYQSAKSYYTEIFKYQKGA